MALEVLIEQTGELHGEGRGTTRFFVEQVGPGGSRHGLPVHPAVLVKALVFTEHQRAAQGGRHIGQGHPLATAHAGVGAQPVQQLAVAVQNLRVRRLPVGLYIVKKTASPCR